MGKERRPRSRRRNAPRTAGRKRQAVLRRVYLLPNLITAGSLFCGILALVNIFIFLIGSGGVEENFVRAAWLILLAGLLDAFDGLIARLTGSESDFGLNFDSLSDLVAFGVAPAMMVLALLLQEAKAVADVSGAIAEVPRAATPACVLYILFAALRLARFNVQAMGQESKTFSGLPVPAAAATVVSTYLAFKEQADMLIWAYPVLCGFLAILMVSKVPYHSIKSIGLKNRTPFHYLVAIMILVVLVYTIDSVELVVALSCFAYVSWGVVSYSYVAMRKFSGKPWRSVADHQAGALSSTEETGQGQPSK